MQSKGSEDKAKLAASSSEPPIDNDDDVNNIDIEHLAELLSPLPLDVLHRERSYQSGQVSTYIQGFESFQRFCVENQDTLTQASQKFAGISNPAERTLNLDICYAAKQDHDIVILEDKNGIKVQMPADETKAPLVQHIASPQVDLLVSFRVRAYSGRKVIGLPLVITEDDLVQTTSGLLNSTLMLSARCDCGVIRPGMPIIEPENAVSAAFFFRVAYAVAPLLPCGCDTDRRLSDSEEDENWYAALCTILLYVVDLYLTLPRTVGFLNARYEDIHVQFEDMRLKCNVENASVSSMRAAALLLTKVCNIYADVEDFDDDNSSDSSAAEQRILTTREEIIERAVHLTCIDGSRMAIAWLCYNKLSNGSPEDIIIGAQNAELRHALLYMDYKEVETLCGKTKLELEPACMPVVHEIVTKMQSILHAAGSAEGVAMIQEPRFLKRLGIRCIPRQRLESIRFHSENEISHEYKGSMRTIAVTKEGAVIAFRKRKRFIRKLLQGVNSLSVLGNGISWDFSSLLDDSFPGDSETVNDALQWKFGPEVFHFVLSKIMTGHIHVCSKSPAASFAPSSSKHDVGVLIWSLLDNRLWREQTFIISKHKNKKRLELYWLPAEGMNYFRVHRKVDGLYRFEETGSTVGQRMFRCAAIFPDKVE